MTTLHTRPATGIIETGDAAAITHFRQSIAGGKHWYLALLEAIGLWETAEEAVDGRNFKYLLDGEAFDWLLLAERLCQSVNGLFPQDEKEALLFHGKPPINIPAREFKKLIGSVKYHHYLNYYYGVTVEEALIMAVQQEVRKERHLSGYYRDQEIILNEAYRRIYGATRTILFRHFRQEKGYPLAKSTSLTELREFTYWLFKFRLKNSDKAKVGSDTKKALDWLKNKGYYTPLERHDSPADADTLSSTVRSL